MSTNISKKSHKWIDISSFDHFIMIIMPNIIFAMHEVENFTIFLQMITNFWKK